MSDDFAPIRPGDLVSEVADRITQAIVTGKLRPGVRLSESLLARQLGISRAPVREAARRLQQMGLLIYQPRRGFFVTRLTLPHIEDLYDVRLRLELYAGELFIARAGAVERRDLADYIERLRELSEDAPVGILAAADAGLHTRVCELTRNRVLLRLFQGLEAEIRLLIYFAHDLFNYADIHVMHEEIVDALLDGDLERYRRLITTHLELSRKTLRERYTVLFPIESASASST